MFLEREKHFCEVWVVKCVNALWTGQAARKPQRHLILNSRGRATGDQSPGPASPLAEKPAGSVAPTAIRSKARSCSLASRLGNCQNELSPLLPDPTSGLRSRILPVPTNVTYMAPFHPLEDVELWPGQVLTPFGVRHWTLRRWPTAEPLNHGRCLLVSFPEAIRRPCFLPFSSFLPFSELNTISTDN